jgi:hypothetical protein
VKPPVKIDVLAQQIQRRNDAEWDAMFRRSMEDGAKALVKVERELKRTARTLTVCFDKDRPNGEVWAVRDGYYWHVASAVSIQVPMTTVYRGRKGRQPRAYLTGRGRVTWCGSRAVLTP